MRTLFDKVLNVGRRLVSINPTQSLAFAFLQSHFSQHGLPTQPFESHHRDLLYSPSPQQYLAMASPTPKGNPGSRAMETALTSNSVDPDAWQQFLITQMTQISMPLARNMLENIGLNSSSTTPFTLLDHGCGLGIVAPVLMETVPPGVVEQSRVVCADLSETLVDTVKHRIEKERWVGCEAKVIDAEVSDAV